MRRLLAWAVTVLCILFGAAALLGPRHADPLAAIPRLAAPARTPAAPAPRTPAGRPDPAAPSRTPAPAPAPRVHTAARKAGVRPPATRPRPLPRIGARPLLRRTLAALASAPSFHGTLTERVSRALPAVEKLMGAGGSLMAPGARVLSIWHDRPDLWRIAARATARAPVTQLTVANGTTVTSWTRGGGGVTRRPQAPESDGPPDLGIGTLLAQLRHGAVLTVAGQARVDGRATYRLHALQRVQGLAAGTVDLWIDGRTYLPLRIDATGPAAIPLVSAGFTRIAFAGSPAARFRFVPPASTKPQGTLAAGGSRPGSGGTSEAR